MDPTKLQGRKRVHYAQGHMNYVCAQSKIPLPRIKVDGEAGPDTEKLTRELKKCFGYREPVDAHLDDRFISRLAKPWVGTLFRSPGQWARGLAYRQKLRRAHRRRRKGTSRVMRVAESMVGKVETGYNDSSWLRMMESDLPHDRLDWMIPGNPYCGFGCIWAWWRGAELLLPDGTVYTPNICPWSGKTLGKLKFTRVDPTAAKPGALVVMHFGSGGAKHVALARGPMVGGVIGTVEFNTSPGSGGSQANGGGVWKRTRSRGMVLCVLNVTPA